MCRAQHTLMISVLILTRNEEQDLPGCLKSVRWSDDIHVYDSCSKDGTLEIARAAGAHVTQRDFDDWSSHQNWGLANISFRHQWVLYVDADERVSQELAASIHQAVQNPADKVAFRMRRRDFWGTRWLKHVQASSYYMRLFRPAKMRYERLVNPVSIPDGPVGEVTGYLDHYPFSKGMTHWLNRHNSYSSLEAHQIAMNRAANQPFLLSQAIFGKDRNQRRFHQKELFYRMPTRPFLKFLLLYLGKRGFLDGRAGFHYAMLQSFYEYMIVLKTRELAGDVAAPASFTRAALSTSAANLENLHANPRINN
ncbi:MAG TPA: glycosyltransferase family 2 protein [Candidatus Dormibacteraeota bacterium]|nr:glycosyltransferase family 2 protein [Candidatus Dormibacteraeota bacterium]